MNLHPSILASRTERRAARAIGKIGPDPSSYKHLIPPSLFLLGVLVGAGDFGLEFVLDLVTNRYEPTSCVVKDVQSRSQTTEPSPDGYLSKAFLKSRLATKANQL